MTSPVREGKEYSVQRLSKILRHNGFGLHFVGGDDNTSGKMNGILSAFFQVLNQYERRGKLIQEMMAKADPSVNPMAGMPFDPNKYGQNKMGSGSGPAPPFRQ